MMTAQVKVENLGKRRVWRLFSLARIWRMDMWINFSMNEEILKQVQDDRGLEGLPGGGVEVEFFEVGGVAGVDEL